MYFAKKQDIRAFPFQTMPQLTEKENMETWAETHSLTVHAPWMLPQMDAYFSTFKVTKNVDGLYTARQMYLDNIKEDPWAVGVWKVACHLSRGKLVKAQSTPPNTRYCALVPLILSALKQSQGIKYSEWSREGIVHAMGQSLADAALSEPPDLSVERLLEIREIGLTAKSGKTAGQTKPVLSSWTLTGIANTELGGLPKLASTMLTQIWCANPALRNNCMILDPRDWDNMPKPLISTELNNLKQLDQVNHEYHPF